MKLQQRIDELITQHGSLRATALVLKIDAGYLSRLLAGKKINPSAALLKRMGLRAVCHYERVKT